MNYPARDEIPWTDEELRLLHKVWLAIHIRRFDAQVAGFSGPDNFYNGIYKAEKEIKDIAGVNLGYSYGWLREILDVQT